MLFPAHSHVNSNVCTSVASLLHGGNLVTVLMKGSPSLLAGEGRQFVTVTPALRSQISIAFQPKRALSETRDVA